MVCYLLAVYNKPFATLLVIMCINLQFRFSKNNVDDKSQLRRKVKVMLRVKFVEILQLIIAVENIDFWCSGECNCLIITSPPFGDKSPNYQIL